MPVSPLQTVLCDIINNDAIPNGIMIIERTNSIPGNHILVTSVLLIKLLIISNLICCVLLRLQTRLPFSPQSLCPVLTHNAPGCESWLKYYKTSIFLISNIQNLDYPDLPCAHSLVPPANLFWDKYSTLSAHTCRWHTILPLNPRSVSHHPCCFNNLPSKNGIFIGDQQWKNEPCSFVT